VSVPFEAALLLGSHARDEGFVQFLIDCRDDGFVLEHPRDADLSEDERREIVISRARILVDAWRLYQTKVAT
jgi:hypothetical protein